MIRALATLVVLVFTVGAVLMAGGPMYEQIGSTVQDDDAVQEMEHGHIIDNITTAVLVYAPLVIVLGFVGWAFVWVLRHERFMGRVR